MCVCVRNKSEKLINNNKQRGQNMSKQLLPKPDEMLSSDIMCSFISKNNLTRFTIYIYIYIYIYKWFWFGLVWFHVISTLLGYLITILSIYIYIYIYIKISFVNE